MKALLLEEYKKLTVTDMPDPEFGDNEVLVQIKACGICGSDIHGFDGSSGRRIPPLIMGHEASGVVAKIGSLVTNVREGDRVTLIPWFPAANAISAEAVQQNLCEDRRVLGVSCSEYHNTDVLQNIQWCRNILFTQYRTTCLLSMRP